MMPADAVVSVLDVLEGHGLQVWLDGGWGVDALVGRQTRKHEDLDIALQLRFHSGYDLDENDRWDVDLLRRLP